MAVYLDRHPEIGMCPYKESHFFATDLRERLAIRDDHRPTTLEEYQGYFEGLQDQRLRGEASGWYLYSAAAAESIHERFPAARIIAMIRNPLTMLPSLHSQLVFWGIEPVEDFEQALALDEERARNGRPRGFVPDGYRSAVEYSGQLQRYIEVFGRERVHVIVYERLRDDTSAVYRETCEFLGVDPAYAPSFEVVNANKQARSRALRRVHRNPPELLRRGLHAVTSQRMRRRAGMVLKRANARRVPRPPTPAAVTESLRPLVSDEVRGLREVAGLDVSFWLDDR